MLNKTLWKQVDRTPQCQIMYRKFHKRHLKMQILKAVPSGVLILILLFVIVFYYKHFGQQQIARLISGENDYSPFQSVQLSAHSAFVYDAKKNKKIFGLNEDSQLPLASLTKIMTAETALRILPENTIIQIDNDSLATEGDSGLFSNEKWLLKDLLSLTLVESSNDGAMAIAETAGAVGKEGITHVEAINNFVGMMNSEAKEFGLLGTYFLNPTGLDQSDSVSGGYGSARDVANLFWKAISDYPIIFGTTRYNDVQLTSLSSLRHVVKNTNEQVGNIPSLLGGKTGFTDLAGGNLVIAFDAGVDRSIVISVLGSTIDGRFSDIEKLVWATLEYLKINP